MKTMRVIGWIMISPFVLALGILVLPFYLMDGVNSLAFTGKWRPGQDWTKAEDAPENLPENRFRFP